MHADIHLMPKDEDDTPLEFSLRADPVLAAAGWKRRHLVEPSRAEETIELYESLGFEVMSRSPTPDDFGSNCKECSVAACRAFVLIYTRRKSRDNQGGLRPTQGEYNNDEAQDAF